MHPLVADERRRWLQERINEGKHGVLVLDIPLLYETSAEGMISLPMAPAACLYYTTKVCRDTSCMRWGLRSHPDSFSDVDTCADRWSKLTVLLLRPNILHVGMLGSELDHDPSAQMPL